MSSSDIEATFIQPSAADVDAISTAATLGAAGNLTINGAATTGGVATFDYPRNVTITSAGDDQLVTFTVTGTDETGAAQTEVITGADTDTAVGTAYFSTVTQIAASAATAGDVSAGSGSAIAAPVFRGPLRLRGIYVVNSATAGVVTFREGSATGRIRMQYSTTGEDKATEYPSIPDYGIRHDGGGYALFAQNVLNSMTLFYS